MDKNLIINATYTTPLGKNLAKQSRSLLVKSNQGSKYLQGTYLPNDKDNLAYRYEIAVNPLSIGASSNLDDSLATGFAYKTNKLNVYNPHYTFNSRPYALLHPAALVTNRKPDGSIHAFVESSAWIPYEGAHVRGYGKFDGQTALLTWTHGFLDTVKKRKQFGKFQTSMRAKVRMLTPGDVGYRADAVVYTWVGGTAVTALADIQDPIASSLYGPLAGLDYNVLAGFIFVNRDHSMEQNYYAGSACYGFGTGVSHLFVIPDNSVSGSGNGYGTVPPIPMPLPHPEIPYNLTTTVDLLFLRTNGPNQLNTFDGDTPYPRIINVQTNKNNGPTWNFNINPSLGVDLTNPKYMFMTTVVNNSDWGFELWTYQCASILSLAANSVSFMTGENSGNPSLNLAIVQMWA